MVIVYGNVRRFMLDKRTQVGEERQVRNGRLLFPGTAGHRCRGVFDAPHASDPAAAAFWMTPHTSGPTAGVMGVT